MGRKDKEGTRLSPDPNPYERDHRRAVPEILPTSLSIHSYNDIPPSKTYAPMILRSPPWAPPWLSLPLHRLLALPILLLLLLSTLPASRADADFESVRMRYDLEDMSGRYGDPPGKYWHESVFHPHYDGRFTDHTLPYLQQRGNLSVLIQAYLHTMADLGAETWLCHGTLLGWWWNRKSLPWDSDVDVQMTVSTVGFLARYYNMTMHDYVPPGEGGDGGRPGGTRKRYMLEINPGWMDGRFEDRLNVIDGRWIDVSTGLFIDITAVRVLDGSKGRILASKDKHQEKTRDLFPLRDSLFEGIPVKVPYNYAKILADEYGSKALTKLEHLE